MQKRLITGVTLAVLILSLMPIASAFSFSGFFKWIFGGGKDVSMSPGSGYSGSGYVPPAPVTPPTQVYICNDSDGGKVYSVKGVATSKAGGATYVDDDRCLYRNASRNGTVYTRVSSCFGLTNCDLQETYCVDGRASNEVYVCPTGQFCSDGACVIQSCLTGVGPNGECNQPEGACIEGIPCGNSFCRDNDGRNENVSSSVTYINITGWSGVSVDYCSGTNVIEYVCNLSTNHSKAVSIPCPSGCANGNCTYR